MITNLVNKGQSSNLILLVSNSIKIKINSIQEIAYTYQFQQNNFTESPINADL